MSNTSNPSAIESLQARIERLEGRTEDKLLFVSRSSTMTRVNESLNGLRRNSMRGDSREENVLILGEHGTAKESTARAIHSSSRRGRNAWFAINCGQLTSHQLDAEIFGYERGAFSGANAAKAGLLEIAQGGTLFLDEIQMMEKELQAKLFHAIHEKSFKRIGGNDKISIDIRLISAAHPEIKAKLSDSGAFRHDLYEAIGHAVIEIPHLRDRAEDIIPMATQFAERAFRSHGKFFGGFSSEARKGLQDYGWPGNDAELLSVIERTALIYKGDAPVSLKALMLTSGASAPAVGLSNGRSGVAPKLSVVSPDSAPSDYGYMALKRQWSDSFEREYLVAALARNGGNVSAASREAQLDRSNFLRLLRRHGLHAQEFRGKQAA